MALGVALVMSHLPLTNKGGKKIIKGIKIGSFQNRGSLCSIMIGLFLVNFAKIYPQKNEKTIKKATLIQYEYVDRRFAFS